MFVEVLFPRERGQPGRRELPIIVVLLPEYFPSSRELNALFVAAVERKKKKRRGLGNFDTRLEQSAAAVPNSISSVEILGFHQSQCC